MRDKRGFSLIELLVVIAIIAILAAILFPIFLRARASAKKAQCSSNMKQIYSALSMYADDNDGRLPLSPENLISGDLTWKRQGKGFTCIFSYCKKTDIFCCPLARMYGTTPAEVAKRATDPEPVYSLERDNGQKLKGSYHFWPGLYQEWRDSSDPRGYAPPGKLDANPYDRSLVLQKSFAAQSAKRCADLRGPLVDSFLHKLNDTNGQGVLMLTLKGDVRFLPVDGYPLYY